MAKAKGFGIELEELRTLALIAGAFIPAMTLIMSAKTGKQMALRTLLGGAVIATVMGVNIRELRKG